MKKCPICFKEVDDNDSFCIYCGYSFAADKEINKTEKLICDECGNELLITDKFCPFCGKSLNDIEITDESINNNESINYLSQEQNKTVVNKNVMYIFLGVFILFVLTFVIKNLNLSINSFSHNDNYNNSAVYCHDCYLGFEYQRISVGNIDHNTANSNSYYLIVDDIDENIENRYDYFYFDEYDIMYFDVYNFENSHNYNVKLYDDKDRLIIESAFISDNFISNTYRTNSSTNYKKYKKGFSIYSQYGSTYIESGDDIKLLYGQYDSYDNYLITKPGKTINIRDNPSTNGKVVGICYDNVYLVYYSYAYNGGYTWYLIDNVNNYWIADDGTWLEIY